MAESSTQQVGRLKFGPYRLWPDERRLWRGADEVKLVGRAFDLLVALVKNAGTVMSHRDLMALAWPNVFVDESNLRVHVAALRCLFSQQDNGESYITTVPRRGYSFVAHVERDESPSVDGLRPPPGKMPSFADAFPVRLDRMVGRTEETSAILDMLRSRRLVSIVGAGGIGKTVLAIAVAHCLMGELDRVIAFVDLSTSTCAEHVELSIAEALRLAPTSDDVLGEILASIQHMRALIVLDNCEHLIAAASSAVERLLEGAPDLRILATSRETLRAEGEAVYRLSGLAHPPCKQEITTASATEWPAVRLFLDRVAASGYQGEITDNEVATIASICRRLDGVPLAIELAAGRVASHGVEGTGQLFDDRFGLMWRGRRNAARRHQTMNAVLDWSYDLLRERDQLILTRLSIFVGPFTVTAAEDVASEDGICREDVADALVSLADKSLIREDLVRGTLHYRLFGLTRAYALARLERSGDYDSVARRHAAYVAKWIAALQGPTGSRDAVAQEDIVGLIANLRLALSWGFSRSSDQESAPDLVAKAVPLLLRRSLLKECGLWCERALAVLDGLGVSAETELILWEGLGASNMFMRGNSQQIQHLIERGLTLARQLKASEQELRLLSAMHIFKARIGDVHGMHEISSRASKLAASTSRDDLSAMTEWMKATAYHLSGNQTIAQGCCESALKCSLRVPVSRFNAFGYDQRIRGLIVLVRTLWLRGFWDQASRLSREVILEAVDREQPVAVCIANIYTATTSIWSHDLDTAARRVDGVIACAEENSLEPYLAVGVGMRGQIASLRGNLDLGIEELTAAMSVLQTERHEVLSTQFSCSLAEAMAARGEHEEALRVLNESLERAKRNGELYLLPEMRRARGCIVGRAGEKCQQIAEHHLRHAMIEARRQYAKGWELRAAVSLGRFLLAQGRSHEAAVVVGEAVAGFDEGASEPIMGAARCILSDARQWDTSGSPA